MLNLCVINSSHADLSFVHLFAEVNVPVIGGHAGITIRPLFSQVLTLSFKLPHGLLYWIVSLLNIGQYIYILWFATLLLETLLIWVFLFLIGHTKSQFVRWIYQGSYQANTRGRNGSCGSKGWKGICNIVNGVSLNWYLSLCVFCRYVVILD